MVQELLEWLKAAGTVLAAISLYLAYRQLRANVRWNRINATFAYLPEALYLERERAVAAALEGIGVDLYKQDHPLQPAEVAAILDRSEIFREAKDFLNLFEDYAAAYRAGAIDPDHSYILSASQFIRYFEVFQPLIEALRLRRRNEMYWSEFERLVTTDWRPRREKEIEAAGRARAERREGRRYP